MLDEAALLHIVIDEMTTMLECPHQECNHGEGGARWRTQPLPENNAMDMMDFHMDDLHGQQLGGGGWEVHDGGGGNLWRRRSPVKDKVPL